MILLLAVSCSKGEQDDNTKVRIGYFPNITHSQALIGKPGGQFQKTMCKKIIFGKIEEHIRTRWGLGAESARI